MIGIAISNSIGLSSAAAAIDPAAAAFIAATGITGATQQAAINNLVKGLKADGIYSKMKAVYPFVTDNRNLLGYTEDFSNAYWSKGGGTTVTANTTIAPDGTTTADTITLPNNGTIAATLTNASSLQTTFTIYLRASANTTIKIGFVSPSVVTTCNVTTSWQRFTITHTFSGVTYPQIYNDTGSSVTLFAWGAQAEYAATATTYQPIATTQQAYIATQFKYNLVNPVDSDAAFRLVFNGGWTHSPQGATPNGTNGWADTRLPNNTMTQNSMTMCTYLRTDTMITTGDLGVWNSGFGSIIYSRNGLGNYRGINNSTSANFADVTVTNSLGFFLNKRTSATQIVLQKNSTQTTLSSNSENLLTSNFIIAKTGDFAGEYSNRQTAFVGIGNGLTDTEAANLYTRVQAYQTLLNRQV